MSNEQLTLEGVIPDHISKVYAFHVPGETAKQSVQRLRTAFTELACLITATCKESRERSVALTNLETTAMWAIKSCVWSDPDSKQEVS